MKPFSYTLTALSFPVLPIILFQATAVSSAKCKFWWEFNCSIRGGSMSATSNVTFRVLDVDATEYDADVVFHWGPTDDDVGSRTYSTGSEMEVTGSHDYAEDGEYLVGYTISYGEGVCKGGGFQDYRVLTFDSDSTDCSFDDYDWSHVPTRIFTGPPTTHPTNQSTPPPSEGPTIHPTTASPSKRPSKYPTNRPTQEPSNNPTHRPTAKPSVRPTSPPSKAPTDRPTKNPTIRPTTTSPSERPTAEPSVRPTSTPSKSPTNGPTKNPTIRPTTPSPSQRPTAEPSVRPTSSPSKTPTDRPTKNPTTRPTTTSPSERPTAAPSSRPTPPPSKTPTDRPAEKPTTRPTTASPSEGPTVPPSASPSAPETSNDRPTTRPPTTASPTRRSATSAPPEGPGIRPATASPSSPPPETPSDRTSSPVVHTQPYDAPDSSPSLAPSAEAAPAVGGAGGGRTSSPAGATTRPAAGDALPTAPPTAPPTAVAPARTREYEVPSAIFLYSSMLLDADSRKLWTDVTTKTIRNKAVAMVGTDSILVEVEVELDDQHVLEQVRALTGRRDGRAPAAGGTAPRTRRESSLDSRPSSPLRIRFTAVLRLPSHVDEGFAGRAVASAFQSRAQRQGYVDALRRAGGGSRFEILESVSEWENGDSIAEGDGTSSGTEPPGVDGAEGGGDAGGDGDATWYTVAIATGGSCALLLAVSVGIYRATRGKGADGGEMRETLAAWVRRTPDAAGSEIEADGGVEKERPPEEAVGKNDRRESIPPLSADHPVKIVMNKSKEGGGDDVSAMGDPYMGDAVSALITDNTIGESMLSSQQELYVYGVRRQQGADAGREGGSTVDSGGGARDAVLGDDATLEDLYASLPPGFRRFAVVAPPGKLGIVLENRRGDLPAVWAVGDASPLRGQVRPGDMLLSLDGADCRGVSTRGVAALLGDGGRNPSRTLVFARGSEMIGV